jgi:RNA polymerase sigma factor (sigma-70 family)
MSVEVRKETSVAETGAARELRGFLEGDAHSGDRLAQLVRLILMRRFRSLGLADSSCEELAQDCLLQVFARLSEYDPERGPFEAWVSGFAANAARSQRRRTFRERTADMPVDELAELEFATEESEATRDLLRTAMASLDGLDRELLQMRYALCMTSEEIAASNNLNAPQVRKRISRAVERLRRHPAIHQLLIR